VRHGPGESSAVRQRDRDVRPGVDDRGRVRRGTEIDRHLVELSVVLVRVGPRAEIVVDTAVDDVEVGGAGPVAGRGGGQPGGLHGACRRDVDHVHQDAAFGDVVDGGGGVVEH